MKISYTVLFLFVVFGCSKKVQHATTVNTDLTIPFEKDNQTSATYEQVIAFYHNLAITSPYVAVNAFGETDSGEPLHEVIISAGEDFTPEAVRKSGKAVLFVNNGIHPGEPCGIDASMMLARDLSVDDNIRHILNDITIVIIPVYNIGGAKNRGAYSRANQVGPKAYGFRGNAKNLDLNRDFIKGDSYNSRSFQKLFTKWAPDVFLDNHTTNGADYQYIVTLIATQKDKLNPILSAFMNNTMLPNIYANMEKEGYPMTPYVYSRGIPDTGIYGFLDSPRYSSGYAALHNTIGFISEAHMLKPFDQRVRGTYMLMVSILQNMSANKASLLLAHSQANTSTKIQKSFALDWQLKMEETNKLSFKGYESGSRESKVTGLPRLYYDRNKPFEKEVSFYNEFEGVNVVNKPRFYGVPQAYRDIVDRMKSNGVAVQKLEADTVINAEVYYIDYYTTTDFPYEGHYLHSNVAVTSSNMAIQLYKGDYLIPTNQICNRYIIETLEPQAKDSWFAWNFFDGILMQKEHFSPYVFEDTAADLLLNDMDLKNSFEAKKRQDTTFASSPNAQLNFIYEHSPYYEKTYKRYPVIRIN